MPSDLMPLNLSSQDGKLTIVWNDGVRMEYAPSELRNSCPCATCRAKRDAPAEGLPVLSMEEAMPTKITGMKPLGNYAYNIAFSDGHATGIYSLELLRELGTATMEQDAAE
jgi:prepilin-type processing-associated H-X9-DG protein